MANDEDFHKVDICSPVLRLKPIGPKLGVSPFRVSGLS